MRNILLGLISEPEHVIQEEIMQFVGSYQIFCLLGDLPVFGREQLRTYRGIQHIIEDVL